MTRPLLFNKIAPSEPPSAVDFEPPPFSRADSAAGYLPDQGLVDAVNVALILGQPLLVTGEPGTGKTQLANAVAYQLGLEKPLRFETKSTTTARDLFYHFDHVGRFRSAQIGDSVDARQFVTVNALGEAILRAQDPTLIGDIVPDSFLPGQTRRSVVLIDEIDKAPRDLPNDILNEIDRLFFRIPELGGVTVGIENPRFRPVIILTSNSEKSLPDAFLRRCIFYCIPFPENDDRLQEIIVSRLGDRIAQDAPLLADCIRFLLTLRSEAAGLRRKPGTAEMLNWVSAIVEFGGIAEQPLGPQADQIARTLASLSKLVEDQGRIAAAFAGWCAR